MLTVVALYVYSTIPGTTLSLHDGKSWLIGILFLAVETGAAT